MATWTRFPEETVIENSYDLRRTPPKQKVKGIFTSDSVESTAVHWFNGRTIQCGRPDDCTPCERLTPYKWMAYFGYVDLADDTHCIFEVTALKHAEIERCIADRNGVRGLQFQSYRPSGKLNGRISFTFKKTPKALDGLPDAPDVRNVMEHIWQPALDVVLAENSVGSPEPSPNGRF